MFDTCTGDRSKDIICVTEGVQNNQGKEIVTGHGIATTTTGDNSQHNTLQQQQEGKIYIKLFCL